MLAVVPTSDGISSPIISAEDSTQEMQARMVQEIVRKRDAEDLLTKKGKEMFSLQQGFEMYVNRMVTPMALR